MLDRLADPLDDEDDPRPIMFEVDWPLFLVGLMDEGYFKDDRPEDRVALYIYEGRLLDPNDEDGPPWSEGDLHLLTACILPLLRIYHYEYERFEEEYVKRRRETP